MNDGVARKKLIMDERLGSFREKKKDRFETKKKQKRT